MYLNRLHLNVSKRRDGTQVNQFSFFEKNIGHRPDIYYEILPFWKVDCTFSIFVSPLHYKGMLYKQLW